MKSGLRATLKNTLQSSLEVMGDAALSLPPVVPSYSIVRYRPRRHIRPRQSYDKIDLVDYALNVVESIESSKESSIEANGCVDSVTRYVSILLSSYC